MTAVGRANAFPELPGLHLLLLSDLIFQAQTFLQHNLVGTLRVPPWLPPPLLLPLSNILALCFPTCSLCDLVFWTSLSQGCREVLGEHVGSYSPAVGAGLAAPSWLSFVCCD